MLSAFWQGRPSDALMSSRFGMTNQNRNGSLSQRFIYKNAAEKLSIRIGNKARGYNGWVMRSGVRGRMAWDHRGAPRRKSHHLYNFYQSVEPASVGLRCSAPFVGESYNVNMWTGYLEGSLLDEGLRPF